MATKNNNAIISVELLAVCFTTHMKSCHAYVSLCAPHQVFGEVIDELSVVQALVVVEVVLKHGCDLL